MKKNIFDTIGDILIYVFIGLVSLICLIPFLQVLATSLSDNAAVISKKVFLIPSGFNLGAYKTVLGDNSMIHSLFFTVLLTIIFTVVGMFLTICCAYPLTVERLKGRKVFSMIFFITLIFNAGIIPNYLLVNSLGLLNSIWCLILPMAFSAFNMIILKSFIQNTIPPSLIESAVLDGCGDIRILINIILPLSTPVLATLALFFAVGRWNTFQDALFYITKPDLYPLQLKLNQLVNASADTSTLSQEISGGDMVAPEVLKSSSIMFATIPIVIVYPFVQKYFVKGVMIGAVKG